MKDEIKEILAILEGRKKMYLHQQKNNSPFNDEEYIAYMILDYITNLQEQLHQASLKIQELTERDIWCPSNCDKLTNLQEEIEEKDRLNNTIDKALGIANERVNYYNHKQIEAEDWSEIFNILVKRDNQELKGSDKE